LCLSEKASDRHWAGRFTVIGLVAVVAGWAGVLSAEETETYSHVLVSDRVNGVHSELTTDLAPIQMGPMTIILTSPSQTLEVLEHQLGLRSVAEGVDAGRLTARYQGRAHLVAELEIAGMSSEIEDHIELPLQEVNIAGKVRIAKEDDSYRITVIDAPSHVEIEVESDLAERLGLLCQGFAVLAMGSVDCDAVDQAMSVIRVPLPEPGDEFVVAGEELTEHEREQFENFLRDRAD